MIGLILEYANNKVEIRVQGLTCYFRTSDFSKFATIDGIKLDYKGVCREHPDLETAEDWREQAIKRFKEKIKQMETEQQIIKYLIVDLRKYGYKPLFIQRAGYRPVRLN
jgi:hypothetical protein